MKKIILTLTLILLINTRGASQGWPVFDNTNFITLGKSIIESAKQTAELLKTVQFLKEQKENIEKVSSVVKQLKSAREITRNNEEIFKLVRDDLKDILNSPHVKPEEVGQISTAFNIIIEDSLENLDFVNQVLSSDFLKMTDSERTEVLKEAEARSRETVNQIRLKNNRYKEIISFREFQDKINNRDSNF